jgi:CheY-like chemotaxis protein
MSNLLRRTLGEAIVIDSVLAPRLWRCSVDANQLEIAILNLAVNARDAMPEGGRLTIETANTRFEDDFADAPDEAAPGDYVVIAVTDSGVGMPPDVVERAFEPFFTTKEIGKGTGLGLSQVYGFVRQSGGHVRIVSEVGRGTSVKLYLPRLDEVEGESPGVVEAPLLSRRDGETVLVVEDDEKVRENTTAMLAELGYRVLEAGDSEAALALLREHADVALMFTDIGLPGRNGRELAAEARRLRPALRVLFTTGYAARPRAPSSPGCRCSPSRSPTPTSPASCARRSTAAARRRACWWSRTSSWCARPRSRRSRS